ncbi:PH domain-containing protein [Halalkalibacillus halophilus]|uniref:PH domain-containing protein n=1 Tax=Halalkalibacillus halophilus TaxID=392827 RepID=UPI00040BAEE6|nr:PH domain-containing protein [Halalkalibacillus halophilus]
MREAPKNRIAKDALKAWKLTAIIVMSVFWALTIGGFVLVYFMDWSYWVISFIAAGVAILTYVTVFLIPKIRWRRWRYEVFDQEIYIQHGILIVSRVLVPMIRVQHVDTKQGPILKKYRLASLTISTAATTHEIPALPEAEAEELRDQISVLARVDEDDV